MQLRQFAGTHPVLTAVSCAGLQFLVTTLILKLGSVFVPASAFGQVKLLAFASTVILPLMLVQAFGLWRQVGLEFGKTRPGRFFLASMLLCVLFLSMGVHLQAQRPLGSEILIQFINAFGEELLFRGLIFAVLLRLAKWKGILISGLLFGAMHLIHGFMDGNWTHAMWWALATTLSGMMFAAVRYETGSLWLTIVLHMVLNPEQDLFEHRAGRRPGRAADRRAGGLRPGAGAGGLCAVRHRPARKRGPAGRAVKESGRC